MADNIRTIDNKEPVKTLHHGNRILRWPEVQQRVGICRSHAHYLASKGQFPKPIKLGERASGWIESQVDDWVEQRIAESQSNDPEVA